MRVDPPTGQQSKTYCKGDSQLVQEKENKGVGITRSITRLELNRTFVEATELPPPPNPQHLKTVCLKEWAKTAPGQCERLVSSYRKRLEAVIANKGFSTEY